MKILFTGASGFLGGSLLLLCAKHNFEVYHLVRKSQGFENEFVWDFCTDLPKDLPGCDIVIHLAAYVGFSLKFSVSQYNVNTLSALRLAEYCRKHSAHFLLASMAGVHGNAGMVDKNTPVGPCNHYGMSKYLAEEILRCIVPRYTILRIGGIYGLDGPSHLGLNVSITQAYHNNVSPTLKGSGEAKRNYICVDDAANWIYTIISSIKLSQCSLASNHKDSIVYISSTEELSVADYLHCIVEVFLPGKTVMVEPGGNGGDSIVKASKPPIKLCSFREYLLGITK
ncbi:MAG: NAD-dependent epimerase/dehydratase family protein [Desulfotalea sp.]